jgi:flagellar biosynthesis protein FliR
VAVPLSLAVAPAQPLALTLPAYAAAVLREAAVGLLMGGGLWLLVWAAFAAGHLQDLVGGFASSDEEEGPLANLFMVVAIVFFVQLNGLHWLLAFLRQSYACLPPGQGADLMGAASWVYWPGLFFTSLLQLAAPAVLATVLAALLIGSLQRVLPDLRTTELLPAARALMTLLALAIVAPLLGALLLQQVNTVAELTTRWLTTLG